MPGRQARILTPAVIRRAQRIIADRDKANRDAVIFLLSLRAGLRAAEIAQLDWSMVLGSDGRLATCLAIRDDIAKKGSGRSIPMHPELRSALARLTPTKARVGPIVLSAKGGAMRPNSIVNWFVVLFAEIGADGCSSHSGRRTFITYAARNAHRSGATLRDVQLLAGHKSIEVTQRYIDGDSDAQRRLIQSL